MTKVLSIASWLDRLDSWDMEEEISEALCL